VDNFFCFRAGERPDFDLLLFFVKEDFLINLDGFLMLEEDFLIDLVDFLIFEEDFLIDLTGFSLFEGDFLIDLAGFSLFLDNVSGFSIFSAGNDTAGYPTQSDKIIGTAIKMFFKSFISSPPKWVKLSCKNNSFINCVPPTDKNVQFCLNKDSMNRKLISRPYSLFLGGGRSRINPLWSG